MVRQGWAVAEFGHDYDEDERQARATKVGAWSGSFDRPKDWRKNGLR
jgi:endonuclease YncB( thermonuclease family)